MNSQLRSGLQNSSSSSLNSGTNLLSPISSTLALFQQQQQQTIYLPLVPTSHIQSHSSLNQANSLSISLPLPPSSQTTNQQQPQTMYLSQDSNKESKMSTSVAVASKNSLLSSSLNTNRVVSNTNGPTKRHFSGSNSSLQNSDNDDEDDDLMDTDNNSMNSSFMDAKTKEERRRLSHTAAEQKRRNAIKVRKIGLYFNFVFFLFVFVC
jgi:hypothetical protein